MIMKTIKNKLNNLSERFRVDREITVKGTTSDTDCEVIITRHYKDTSATAERMNKHSQYELLGDLWQEQTGYLK